MKNLLTITAIAVSMSLSAQSGRKAVASTSEEVKFTINSQAVNAKPASQTCDSIVTMNLQTATVSVFTAGTDTATPGCAPYAGWVDGTNCYGDKEKANFNAGSLYGSLSNASVTALQVMFFRNPTTGRGTQGGTGATVGAKIYNGTLAGGPTGAALGTVTNPMATVLASHTNSASSAFFYHTFTFAAPIAVQSSGFYASVVIPDGTTAGDTAVVAAQVSPSANIGWEYWSNNTWVAYTATNSWGSNKNMLIIPKYCFTVSGVNVSENMGISKSVDVYPNPSNGNIKISTAFISPENLNITVTNVMGQVVYNKNVNTMIDVLDLDLSNESNGMYFVTVSNGTDKMVTRMIINK